MSRFEEFVAGMTRIVDATRDEATLLERAEPLLAELIAHDDWLPPAAARARSDSYAQYLLHLDPKERFSVVSFVWGPGQKTPVHDHTVWGLVGVLRGAELCSEYTLDAKGRAVSADCEHVLQRGQIEAVSPTVGDVHKVANALADAPSISIHVYGGNIGTVRRHSYDPATGEPSEFVSGYTA